MFTHPHIFETIRAEHHVLVRDAERLGYVFAQLPRLVGERHGRRGQRLLASRKDGHQ